jgi:hypothetical protein
MKLWMRLVIPITYSFLFLSLPTIALLSSTASALPQNQTSSPTYIKGIYMTYYAAGHDGLRQHAFDLIETTELNALVVDIKGDLGLITYKSDVVTATAIGANDAPMIADWPAFMQELKERNVYAIARIVVFKDNYLARAHPEWAVTTAAGELWLDREELPWLEAFHEEVWDYNIALAVEAAERGFDEIQFDYVRFPTDGALNTIAYSQPADSVETRTAAINGFLAKARSALAPYKVKLAADVFGYTTWYEGDFGIGQDLSQMAAYLDVLSPMVYPSTYRDGLPGLSQYNDLPIAHPYAIVYESMLRALSKVKATNPEIIVRPWIQDFPDYAFDGRIYTPGEVREQMFAAYDSGGGGWLLWDPRVQYTPAALVTAQMEYSPNELGEIMALRYETFGGTDEGFQQRSLSGFRQDLEWLWAEGYYPVNLQDLAAGSAKYSSDLTLLRQEGWFPIQSDELLRGRLNIVPAGKRPVVLTFDGSHVSQYRLLGDGSLDPNSALGVLLDFHNEHTADWPLRATFFVQPEADDPAYQLFGQPEFVEKKLQTLVDLGMEIGSYTLSGADLAQSDYVETRRQLSSEALIEALLPGYEVVSLALPRGERPQFESLLGRGIYRGLSQVANEQYSYDYQLVAVLGDEPIPSPRTTAFTPYHIPRIQANAETVQQWLEKYQQLPETYYVASGIIPETRPITE